MRFALVQNPSDPAWYEALCLGLQGAMRAHGHTVCPPQEQDVNVVFYRVDAQNPSPFPRKHRATFAVGITRMASEAAHVLEHAYPLLIRSISNSLITVLEADPEHPWIVTPELGCYQVQAGSGGDLYEALYQHLAPMATSHLVIDNVFVPNLPEALCSGTAQTEELRWAAHTMDGWGLLPTPFPVQKVLSPAQWRYLKHLYGIGGLSYGNFSIRHDADSFWMSASGVNKGNLRDIGRDILLVTDYDREHNRIVLSVPPHVTPRRVSVDAIEHFMIYRRFPQIGAIVHVHAWVPGVPVTAFNYPCGTIEIGHEMVGLLSRDGHPERTIIGMLNHGITATGPNFHDIVARLADTIVPQVPMTGGSLK